MKDCDPGALKSRIQQTLKKKFSPTELSKKSFDELLEELSIYYQELEIQNDELQRTQKELESRTRQWEDLYENAPIGYATYTPDGILLRCNRMFREMIGVQSGKCQKDRIQHFIAPESQDAFHLHLQHILKGDHTSACCTLCLKRKDGTEFHVRVESNLLEESDVVHHVRSTFIDITQQVTAERQVHLLLEELRQKNLQLQESQSRLETALLVGNIFWWNMELPSGAVSFHPGKARILGYSPESFKHYNDFMAILHPEDSDFAYQNMLQHLEGKTSHYRVEYRIRASDGKYRWFYDFGMVTGRDEHGNPLLIQGVAMDITRQKEAELELNRQLSLMRSIVALLKLEVTSEEQLFDFVLNEALKLASTSRGCLYTYNTRGDSIVLKTVACRMGEGRACPSPSRQMLKNLRNGGVSHIVEESFLYIPLYQKETLMGLLILSYATPITNVETITIQINILFRTSFELLDQWIAKIHRETYFHALQSIQQPVVITDPHGNIEEVNNSFLKMYEYEEAEIIGKNPRILNPGIDVYKNLGYTEEEYKALFKGMWKSILDPSIGQWEGIVVNRTKSGSLLWVQLYISAIRDQKQNVQHFIALPVDISGLKKQEYNTKIDLYRTIARLSELRDNETGNHMRRVGIYARLLAKGLGMTEKYCEEIELFAPMHDIGKVGISDTILLVNRPLTKEEYEEIKNHTLLGYNIVRDKEELKMAADIILYHHERWDGKGYPYGLKEEAIPLSARITAVADVYDALRSKRPYKEEWTHEATIAEIVQNSGKAFDPTVVQVFLQLAKRFDEVFTNLKD